MKKHHKLLIALTIVGILFLLYLWYKHASSGASTSTGAVDTSSLPTIISAGGGSISPTSPSFMPTNFDTGYVPQPPSPTATAVQQPPTPSINIMPGTSGSGVPQYTNAAQEFNTNQPVAAPSSVSNTPSFYQSATDIPLQQVSNAQVAEPDFGGIGSPNATLQAFLENEVRSSEIGSTKPLPSDLASGLATESTQYCNLHPEACSGQDQSSIISGLIGNYTTYLNAARATNGLAPLGAPEQGTAIQNPITLAPISKPTSAPVTTQPLGHRMTIPV